MRCSRFNLQFFFFILSLLLLFVSPFHFHLIELNALSAICHNANGSELHGRQTVGLHSPFLRENGTVQCIQFFFFAVFKLKFKDSRWHIAVNEFIGRKTANIFVVRFRFFVFFILLFFVLLSSMRYSHWKRTYHLIIKGKNVESFKKEKSLPRFCHWYCLC